MGRCVAVHVEYRPPPDFLTNHSFFYDPARVQLLPAHSKKPAVSGDAEIHISQSFKIAYVALL